MKNSHLTNQCMIHEARNNNKSELGGERALRSMSYLEYKKQRRKRCVLRCEFLVTALNALYLETQFKLPLLL